MFEVEAGGDGVVSLIGELDLAKEDAFLRWVTANVDCQRGVVFDCSGLTFLDSSGVRAILRIAAQAPSLVVRSPRPNVRKVLEITGINEVVGVTVEP